MKIGLNVKINRFSKAGPAATFSDVFSKVKPTKRPAFQPGITQEAKDKIIQDAIAVAKLQVLDNMMKNREKIVKAIRTDLNRFGQNVVLYFTKLKSPLPPPDYNPKKGRKIRLRKGESRAPFVDIRMASNVGLTGGNIYRRSFATQRPENVLRWRALSRVTIDKKARKYGHSQSTTFFLATGDLRQALGLGLGQAYVDLVNPQITFESVGDDIKKDLSDVVRVMNVKALLNPRFQSSLFKDIGAGSKDPGKSEKLVLSYVKRLSVERGLAKLANIPNKTSSSLGQENPYRPFLQPALAFWIVVRLPELFQRTIRDHMKEVTVKSRTQASRSGGDFSTPGV